MFIFFLGHFDGLPNLLLSKNIFQMLSAVICVSRLNDKKTNNNIRVNKWEVVSTALERLVKIVARGLNRLWGTNLTHIPSSSYNNCSFHISLSEAV